jgi:4-hydroxybenzoate polyprenyltransferase
MNLVPRVSGTALPLQLLRLLRPYQWIKNGFVFVGLIFGQAAGDLALVRSALLAAAGFCLMSSCIYILNDVLDRKADRSHPSKRTRPVASGAVGPRAALVLAFTCGSAGLALGAAASAIVLALLVIYLLLNLAYSAGLKNVAVLDVFIIAAGFMLRIFAGTWGIGIVPSGWLLLCALLLTVFLGFAKRRAELMAVDRASANGGYYRPVLYDYTPARLDRMIAVSAIGAIVAFSLYAISPDTIALHGTDKLIYTLPFVLYGMFRYIFLLHQRGGEDPAWTLLTDAQLLVTSAAWLGVTLWLI